ncbi:MAG: electron transport complex subunit RsxC, partial [Faecalibacillus sp.]
GAPAKAIVKVKDEVKVGQIIGEAQGFVSANVISSVSGTVKSIEPRLDASGNYKDSIVIINDGQYTKSYDEHINDISSLSNDEILTKIKAAGIVGRGGAGFPTHVKLSPKDRNKIDYIIVNGAECEPYLTSDYRLMLERSQQIIAGLNIILKLFPNAKGIIGIEDNKPEAIQLLTQKCVNETKIEVKSLPTKYPQGGERSLIYVTTGRKIYSKMLPADAGCIVDNVATTIAIYQAVKFDQPLISTVMTLTGDAMNTPCNVEVPTGTNFQYILDQNGGLKNEPEKIISGGPMMGMALMSLDIPTTKTSSSILAFTKDEVAANEPTPCIHCGRCVDVCPSRIVPQLMYRYSEKNDLKGFVKVNGMECIECGCCSYICPAKRNMTQSFRKMKRLVIAASKK